jgi:hypothetical protein
MPHDSADHGRREAARFGGRRVQTTIPHALAIVGLRSGSSIGSTKRRSRDTEFIPLRKQVRRAHGYTATMSAIAI